MSLAIAAEALHSPLVGNDAVFNGVTTDTRHINQGDLFFALKGDNYDGHNFLAEALNGGAAGAVLSKETVTALPYIRVEDTRLSLGDLAHYWRKQFSIPMIAVTGSNGKTTVKEMIAAVLSIKASVLATQGNLNNDIGLPLTLLRLTQSHQFTIVEMGMNHRGEIYYLTNIAQPTIALINNAGAAHIEGLGSIEEVAKAKGEIFAGLPDSGIAVINADDQYADLWLALKEKRHTLTFGINNKAHVRGSYEANPSGSLVHIETKFGDIDIQLPVLGKHNAMNALAAAATCLAAGADLSEIKQGLESVQAVAGRLQLITGINGSSLINDTYNANPSSLLAALDVLSETPGERVLVLGDMGELGDDAVASHQLAGQQAKKAGVSRLFALGPLSRHTVDHFGKGGRHYSNEQALAEDLLDCMHADMTILVKGSRAMRMEQIVSQLQPQNNAGVNA